jgi:hypothetical protein
LYAVSKEDSIYVYDLRHDQEQQQKQPQKEKEKAMGLLRFQLALPPINRATTSRYIQLRRNALPPTENPPRLPPFMDGKISLGNDDSKPVPIYAPFYADPHERLIVARVVTSPVERGEEQFELHIPARAFLDHFSVAATGQTRQRDGDENKAEEDGAVVVPWSRWRNAVRATPPRRLPYAIQARMVVYGMRAVAHPPDWDKGVLHVDSYLSRRREEAREAEADTTAGAGAGAEARAGMRQAIRLPREVEDKADFLTVLCEDALLCYKVGPISTIPPVPLTFLYSLIRCRARSRMRIGIPFRVFRSPPAWCDMKFSSFSFGYPLFCQWFFGFGRMEWPLFSVARQFHVVL